MFPNQEILFKIYLLVLEREERRRRERDRERGKKKKLMWERNINVRNIDWLLPIWDLTGDQTHNIDVFPDKESNIQPFGI